MESLLTRLDKLKKKILTRLDKLKKKSGTTTTIPFAEKEEIFLQKHPEFENFTPIILGLYRTCQAKKLRGRMRIDLEEAYHHIFEEGGKGCSRCKMNFKSLAEYQEEFFK